jgi:hypothetical protein
MYTYKLLGLSWGFMRWFRLILSSCSCLYPLNLVHGALSKYLLKILMSKKMNNFFFLLTKTSCLRHKIQVLKIATVKNAIAISTSTSPGSLIYPPAQPLFISYTLGRSKSLVFTLTKPFLLYTLGPWACNTCFLPIREIVIWLPNLV